MTVNEYRRKAYHSSKYHNKKTECNFGHIHDSKSEAIRCDMLHQLQTIGRISELRTQVKYILIPAQREPSREYYKKGKHKGEAKPGKVIEHECAYYADFDYIRNGEHIVEDVKGVKTEAYKIKKKLMLERHGIHLTEVQL